MAGDHSNRSSNEHSDIEAAPFLGSDATPKSEGLRQEDGGQCWTWARVILLAGSVFVGLNVLAFSVVAFDKVARTSTTLAEIIVTDVSPASPRHRPSSAYILSPSRYLDSPQATREYHWTITDAIFNPDGIFRPMMLINNQFPGPLIECNEGDNIVVHVRNEARNATAIHFHGIFQNGTNSMDGTVGVTQCPIATDQTLTYRFTVKGQSGTYWYHGHHSAQSTDGLVGPLVIHPRQQLPGELSYASDRIVMIQDHYHNTSAELLMDYLQSDNENEEPVPSSGLINGRNYRSCQDFEGWKCSHTTGHLESLEVLRLEPGKNHRLRFINTGAFAEFQVELDEHPLYVTEVDGTATHPEPFDRVNILPAQRYSAIITANATAQESFWLRGRMVTHCFATDNPWLESEVKAIVQYSSISDSGLMKPETKAKSEQLELTCRDLNTTELRPMDARPAPPATSSVLLRANFEIGAWRLSRGVLNSSSWSGNMTYPTLHRLLDSNATNIGPSAGINEETFNGKTELVYQTRGIQVLDIIISNFDDGAHPFHLHGHRFSVLKEAGSGYPPESPGELEEELRREGRLENPLRRDTVTLQAYGWVVIRVVLDNPGVWAFHCHNTWHAEAGMMMVFAARIDEVGSWNRGEDGRRLCSADGVGRGARPSDDIWEGNFG